MKRLIIYGALAFLIILVGFQPAGRSNYRIKKIIIDAGHGGKDPGTHGQFTKEKDIALKVALKLGELVKERMEGVEVIYTRDDNRFIELDERANIANQNNADLFISIHCNSTGDSKIRGTETWIMGLHKAEDNLDVSKRENAVILLEEDYEQKYEGFDPNAPESHILFSLYQNAFMVNSLKLAQRIEKRFTQSEAKRHSRGVKQAGFWVLWRTSMPSVLVEIGFLTNAKEEKYLMDKLGQTYTAASIFQAISDYKTEIESM